jgi:lipopolysaccharide export system protein LptC
MMQLGTRTAITFPLVLLAFIAMITYWINYTVQPESPKIDGSSRHDPDYIMTNFETTQTDIKGNLSYKLSANEMRHFPDDDTTELQKPRYTQFAINKPYTRVEGMRGFVSSNGEEVKLVDNVVITRQAYNGKGEMTVETDYLNIRPNEDLVTTDRPVVIKQAPKTVIYATGMIYEKKKKTVTLLKRVRAHYEKPLVASNPAKTKQTKQKKSKQKLSQQKKKN